MNPRFSKIRESEVKTVLEYLKFSFTIETLPQSIEYILDRPVKTVSLKYPKEALWIQLRKATK